LKFHVENISSKMTIKPKMKTTEKKKHLEAALDEGLKESFPASDPVAISFIKPDYIVSGEESSSFTKRAPKKHTPRSESRKKLVDQAITEVDEGGKHREIELKLGIDGKHAAQMIKRMPQETASRH